MSTYTYTVGKLFFSRERERRQAFINSTSKSKIDHIIAFIEIDQLVLSKKKKKNSINQMTKLNQKIDKLQSVRVNKTQPTS